MSRGRSIAVGALMGLGGLALIAAIVVWWFATHKRVQRTIDLPPTGEAVYNPLYALKLALELDHRRVDARQRLQLDRIALRPQDTVVLLSDPRVLSPRERSAVMAFVAEGGHLIVRTPPVGGPLGSEGTPILSELGITVNEEAGECMTLVADGVDGTGAASASGEAASVDVKSDAKSDAADADANPDADAGDDADDDADDDDGGVNTDMFCDSRRFVFHDESHEVVAWWDDDSGDSSVYARVPHGKGSVDVLADLDFLRNDDLEFAPNRGFARRLLQPNYDAGGTFHLIYRAEMATWYQLLAKYGWRALVSLLVALLLWLWMRAQRFGPLLPSAPEHRRSLIEHVQASGDHLFRYHRAATLHAAVLDAFERRLRRRDPYAAALDGPARIEAIARRTGLPAADVEAALRFPRAGDRRDFVHRIARLLQLRHRL